MNRLKFEAFQIGVYCDIVLSILDQHKDLSVAKILFFSYLINKNRFFDSEIYNARNKQNILSKAISVINGDFAGFANAVPFIIKALHILSQSNKIYVEKNNVHLIDGNCKYSKGKESGFVYNAIEVSKSWSDKRFMREVLHNV